MTCAGQGLSLLWKHLTFDELLYPESHTDGLRERSDFSESGVKTCCLTNIGSALQIQQVRACVTTSGVCREGLIGSNLLNMALG